MEDRTTENRMNALISSLDAGIESLTSESAQISALHPELRAEIHSYTQRISRSYMQAMKNLLAGGSHAEAFIEELQIQLTEKRIAFLTSAIEYTVNNIKKTVNSPLWFGERNTYLEAIDKIRDDFQKVNAEPDSRDRNLQILITNMEETSRIIHRLKGDGKRSRLRRPFQIILWGLPIVVGVWASGRLTFSQNTIILLFLFLIAALAFAASKFRLQSRVHIISNYFKSSPSNWSASIQFIITIPLVIGALGIALLGPFSDFLVESRMKINVGETPPTLKKGSILTIPYRLFYDHESPAVGVKVRLSFPGILKGDRMKSFNVITESSGKTGDFQIKIPDDIPEGSYLFELTVSFDASRAISVPFIRKRSFHTKTQYFEISIE